MTLVEAEPRRLEARFGLELAAREPSWIEPCTTAEDRAARLWIMGRDRAFRAVADEATPPVWLSRAFKWGPHGWPVRWADIPAMPRHDCGLMAALSTELFRERGHPAVAVQLILSFNRESIRGWSDLWRNQDLDFPWCGDGYAYHEGTGVIAANGEFRVWDPLGRFWLPFVERETYEGICALRLCALDRYVPLARIGGRGVPLDRWLALPELASEPSGRAPDRMAWAGRAARMRG